MKNIIQFRPAKKNGIRQPAVLWMRSELEREFLENWIEETVSRSSLEGVIRSSWVHRPTLRPATLMLAEYISAKWPTSDDQSSLLSRAIDQAARSVDKFTDHPDIARGNLVGAYLHGLLDIASDLARVTVIGVDQDGTTHQWEPFRSTLHAWATSKNIVELEGYASVNDVDSTVISGIRTRMLSAVTTLKDAGLYRFHMEENL